MLFFSEIYYPAWKAYVDGKPAKFYRAFTSLRAVEVPAGTHTIVLRYESSAFAMGSMMTIITLMLVLVASVRLWCLRRRCEARNHGVIFHAHEKILILALPGIGDALLATPMIELLR